MEHIKYDERIEAYLLGELASEEVVVVEARLQRDEYFRQQVALHEQMLVVIGTAIQQELVVAASSSARPRLSPLRVSWKRPPLRRLAVAVSVLILLAGGAFFWWSQAQSEQVIAETLRAQEAISFGRAGTNDELLFAAETAFNNGEYEQAIKGFDEHLANSDEMATEVQLKKGVALRLALRYEEATEVLQNLIATADQHYSGDDAKWELALVKAAQGDTVAAQDLLRDLRDHSRSEALRQQARRLLFHLWFY